jgi:hypothetical protein
MSEHPEHFGLSSDRQIARKSRSNAEANFATWRMMAKL